MRARRDTSGGSLLGLDRHPGPDPLERRRVSAEEVVEQRGGSGSPSSGREAAAQPTKASGRGSARARSVGARLHLARQDVAGAGEADETSAKASDHGRRASGRLTGPSTPPRAKRSASRWTRNVPAGATSATQAAHAGRRCASRAPARGRRPSGPGPAGSRRSGCRRARPAWCGRDRRRRRCPARPSTRVHPVDLADVHPGTVGEPQHLGAQLAARKRLEAVEQRVDDDRILRGDIAAAASRGPRRAPTSCAESGGSAPSPPGPRSPRRPPTRRRLRDVHEPRPADWVDRPKSTARSCASSQRQLDEATVTREMPAAAAAEPSSGRARASAARTRRGGHTRSAPGCRFPAPCRRARGGAATSRSPGAVQLSGAEVRCRVDGGGLDQAARGLSSSVAAPAATTATTTATGSAMR